MTPDTPICAYCGSAATEREHVIARQFFPKGETYRGDPVLVPACESCNRAKQRVEDIVGVFLPFAGEGEAAQTVIDKRVRRTLTSRPHLHILLKSSFQERFVPTPGGKIVKRTVFVMDDRVRDAFKAWYEFVVRGLYRSVSGSNLPIEHEVTLLWLTDARDIQYWQEWIAQLSGGKTEQRASGEVRFMYALGQDAISSAWVFHLYGATVFAVTHHLPDGLLRTDLTQLGWI